MTLNREVIDSGYVPISASDNPAFFRPQVRCRPLKTEEVEQLVASFGEAARIVAEAGIDGIEVHGHEGYIIDQFTTALWNRRTDRYGGDLRGRLTFSIEILKAIREAAGPKYPVIYRYGAKHFLKDTWKSTTKLDEKEVGRDLPEAIEMAHILEQAGYDGLHIDAGCYESAYWAHPPMYLPHGFSVDLTAKVKAAVNIPVIAVGKMDVPELAEQVVSEGKADIVAIGRALLSDPHWAKKVRTGQLKQIKPCISCHEGMHRTETRGQYLTCALNPACGNDGIFRLEPTRYPKKVLVAGGGIAGMEAAISASLRGHKVVLCESAAELGGQLIPASGPNFKEDIKRLLDYYRNRVKDMGIDIRLNTTVTSLLVNQEAPEVVIVAVGAIPLIPPIKGVNGDNVISCLDVYQGRGKFGDSVIVIGGGLEGCEAALELSQRGRKVTIVEMCDRLEPDVHRANRIMLMDLLEDNGVHILTGRAVIEITKKGVVLEGDGLSENHILADTIVLATGMQSRKDLFNVLSGEQLLTYEIGDCKQPRKILDAVWEANMIAAAI